MQRIFLCPQDGLKLNIFQCGLGTFRNHGKIGDQRGWFVERIVLTEGDEEDIFSGKKGSDTGGGNGESVVGGGSDEYRTVISQVCFGCHGDTSVSDAAG